MTVPFQPNLLHHQAKLHWRKVVNLPVGMADTQVVMVGEKVCVGGGHAGDRYNHFLVCQYDPARDKWTTLFRCPVCYFGLGQLSGELLTVGGATYDDDTLTDKVYRYKPESREWEEYLQPMPTARGLLTVISTQSTLSACGGATDISSWVPCSTVEVYTTETSQWHTTDPLPVPCGAMSSATINNTAYLLGGVTTDDKVTQTVLYAPVASLIQRATSHPQQSASAARPDSTSAWKTLRDTPLVWSAAASLGGTLLAVGGNDDQKKTLPAVHVYSPATRTWIRVESGDLPELRYFCTAVELSANRLLVIGGGYDRRVMNTVFLGSFTIGI